MSETSNNLAMEQSFRAVAQAIDQLPQEQTTDFLARLVLVLAHELQDATRFAQAVERARAPLVQGASA